MRSSFRKLAASLTMLLLLSGCSGFARHGAAPETTILPTTYGNKDKLPPITRFADYKKGRKGLLRVHLFDDRARPLVGAYINYKGSGATGKAPTNAKGIMEVLIPPGRYKVSVAPCGPSVITKDYEESVATVVAGGQPSEGVFDNIRWERRFHPVASVDYSIDPPWKIGRTVRAAIRVEDRCSFNAAKRAPLPTFRWGSSKNFAFESQPPRVADAKGNVNIVFHCVARGTGNITVADISGSGEEPLNILDAGAGTGGRDFCRR